MGRARGQNGQVAVDGFNQVMGASRGRSAQTNPLFADRNSPTARAAADRIWRQAQTALSETLLSLASDWRAPSGSAQEFLQEQLRQLAWERAGAPIITKIQNLQGQLPELGAPLHGLPDRTAASNEAFDDFVQRAGEQQLTVAAFESQLQDSLQKQQEEITFSQLASHAQKHGGVLLDNLLPSNEIMQMADYQELASLSDDDVARVLGHEKWEKAFAQAGKDPLPAEAGKSRAQLGAFLKARVVTALKNEYPDLVKQAQDRQDARHAKHPTIELTNLTHDVLVATNMSKAQLKDETGLSQANLDKLLSRSTRQRSQGNSGRIASLGEVKKFCAVAGVDWGVTQLATLPVELADAKRRPNGNLYKTRYNDIQECIGHLRKLGAPADALDIIQAHAAGTILPDPRDISWQEPYRELVAWERTRALPSAWKKPRT